MQKTLFSLVLSFVNLLLHQKKKVRLVSLTTELSKAAHIAASESF